MEDKKGSRIIANVSYDVKPGKLDEFIGEIEKYRIAEKGSKENGNFKYQFSVPTGTKDKLFLVEMWSGGDAIAAHVKTEHYLKLQELKKIYVDSVKIEKYAASVMD
jgi:quinol monooxygenase YgiN